ncbi:activating signal cointegrator 1 complex subunit 1 [Tribolium castaneum]|uniref:Activating signal cointegrator 1 complex subunit 1-like Protein n=1 Tax=Tribolium castaneum TaxID=7070 RepID=D6WJR9_TRICA|nr:PREDICTED: activating signal cointegrator 1 complex subunit 1 [Tribolium castaneum]EFA04486.1 Activating signal cointegrator 1 complex subunit 1-like Protein [Tribolium castaneum]|eukprot:XP_001811897.1 PREDICTED: activating signal cointegrator 1 complex subunit 1 [Tribolium castaneum]
MGDGEPFPSFFFSRAPLPERVDLITFKEGKKDKFYWMLSIDNDSRNNEPMRHSTLAPYDDNDAEMLDCCDLEENYEINPTKSGKFITSFYVPNALHSVIVGPRGAKLRELQDNTSTLIKVPKPGEDPIVKITGHSERSVASARTQIALLLLSRREKLAITHFVSIPIYSDNIRDNFRKFKDDILKGPATRGVDETIFQKVEKFHLTIVTLALLDEKEIDEAKQMLNKCQSNVQKIFAGRRPKIVLKGVEIMNDDPHEVDVLYGKVCLDSREDVDCLQEAADEILDVFYRNGLVRKQYDNVKLHVTLMNSIFRKNEDNRRESFDASFILDKYKDYYFGKTALEQIHLSVRFTSAQNGYYQSAAVITL